MFVASYSRTMASAKPKFRESAQPTFNLIESKIRKAEAASAVRLAAKQKAADEREAMLRRLKLKADIAVKAANEALRALNESLAAEAKSKQQSQRRVIAAPMSMADVLRRLSRATGVSVIDIKSSRRSREAVFARQAVMYWAARRTGRSFPEIGRFLGLDHTTVIHGKRVYVEKRAAQGRTLRPAR